MTGFRSSELHLRIEGHFGSSGGGDRGAYEMFFGTRLPQVSSDLRTRGFARENNTVVCFFPI